MKNTSRPDTITEEDQEDLAREKQGEHSDSDREFLDTKKPQTCRKPNKKYAWPDGPIS